MTRYYCDRCGCELPSAFQKNCFRVKIPKINDAKELRELKEENTLKLDRVIDADLCSACLMSLVDWVLNGKESVVENG